MARRQLERNNNVIRLVPPLPPPPPQSKEAKEVTDGLEEIIGLVRDGSLTGFVFGGILKGRKYFVGISGSAYSDPTMARGVLCAIDDELQLMVQDRTDRSD